MWWMLPIGFISIGIAILNSLEEAEHEEQRRTVKRTHSNVNSQARRARKTYDEHSVERSGRLRAAAADPRMDLMSAQTLQDLAGKCEKGQSKNRIH